MTSNPWTPPGTGLTPVDDLIDRFLAKAATQVPARKRVVIAIDATASRQPTWDVAADAQARMLEAAAAFGGLELQVVYFQGFEELKASAWHAAAGPLVRSMSKVTCKAGLTQWGRALRHIREEHERQPVAAAILIGDNCEESFEGPHDGVQVRARELGLPAYCFVEGDCPLGRAAFGMIADVTKGALLPFDNGAADKLKELLRAVAAYVAGGPKALAGHSPEVRQLLGDGS